MVAIVFYGYCIGIIMFVVGYMLGFLVCEDKRIGKTSTKNSDFISDKSPA